MLLFINLVYILWLTDGCICFRCRVASVTSLPIPGLSTHADNKTSIPCPIMKYSVPASVSTEMPVLVLYSICKKVVWVHPYLSHFATDVTTNCDWRITRLYVKKKEKKRKIRLCQSGKDMMSKYCYRQIYTVVYHITNVTYRVDLNIRQLLDLWSFPLSHSVPPFSLALFPFTRLSYVISFVILPLFPLALNLQFYGLSCRRLISLSSLSLPGLLFVVLFIASPFKINADGIRPAHHMYALQREGMDLRTGWTREWEKRFHVVSSRLCAKTM